MRYQEEEPTPITNVIAEVFNEDNEDSNVSVHKNKIPICKQVFIDERFKHKRIPYWKEVQKGECCNLKILYTNPNPCILGPSTNIVYSETCSYNFKELKTNIMIEEDCGTGRIHVYVYPKNVWKEIHDFYIKPLSENKDPYNVGVILMGAPGTGKSRLAKIIAKYAGLNVFTIDTGILSKWVGESENKLKKIIKNARESQPSIVIIDDAEWILLARSLANTQGEGVEGVRLNLQQILFSAMQEIYDKKERVLFIATTNVKQEVLDQALIRHGRFGPPIFVPLPDLEAAKIIVSQILSNKSVEEIEKIAFLAVNAGLSIADTIALAEKVRRGGEPKPRTVGGRGYSRIFVDIVKEFNILETKYKIPISKMLSTRSRLAILGNEDIATAIAVQLAYSSKKTVIKLVDVRHLDEAIHSTNMLGSVLLVPTRFAPEIQYYIHDNLDTSLIWIGEKPPVVESFIIGDIITLMSRVGIESVVKAVISLRGIKISDSLMRKIMNKVAGDYTRAEKILKMIITTGVVDEEYFENMVSWMR